MRLALIAVLVGGCDVVFSLDRPDGWSDVAVGFTHACAISADRELYCWGSNTYGEVGIGDELSTIDTPSPLDGAWTQVSTSYSSTCGVKDDHTLWCWGMNAAGNLGNGSTSDALIPKQVDGTWASVHASYLHTCAIDEDEHLWCWGINNVGQLGDGSLVQHLEPAQIGDATWIDVAGGTLHTCGIQKDGTLWCWGDDASTAPVEDPALAMGSQVPQQLGTDTWRSITAVVNGTCGITTAGTLRCWGMNDFAQLGLGTARRVDTPMPVLVEGTDADDWVAIEGGMYTGCGLRANGDAWCWGNNERGELTGDALSALEPARVEAPDGGRWTQLSAGAGNTCLVDDRARLWCAGGDSFSQLGDGGTSPRTPVPPAPDAPADVLVAGDHATCALRNFQLSCGGRGGYLQLALGDSYARRELAPVEGGPWSAVTLGFEHGCAIGDNGVVSCWGTDRIGAVGNGTGVMPANVPTPVDSMRTYSAIDAGPNFTCAIDSLTKGLACWGDNFSGQLGLGDKGNRSSPTPLVAPALSWIAISAGFTHTCGIDTMGKVHCWGNNTSGQLGDDTMDERLDPNGALVTGGDPLPAFASISAGGEHTCAIGANDSLWCWGSNRNGQLGVDTQFSLTSDRAMQVAGTWSAVSTGSAFTCAIRTDQTLWCWGSNLRGQLGDGSLNDHRAPAEVDGTGWTAVTAGTDHVCARRGTSVSCWGNNDDGATLTGDSWTSELQQIVRPTR